MTNTNINSKVGYTLPIKSAFEMFYASREAMGVTVRTMQYYKWNGRKITEWFEKNGIYSVHDITKRDIDAYLTELRKANQADNSISVKARVIKSFLIYLRDSEEILEKIPRITMPRIHKKELRTLTSADVNKVLSECKSIRELSLVLLMVDSGLRRNEVINLNWKDVDLSTGRLAVHYGKGDKFRVSAIGKQTKKHLIRYKIDLEACDPSLVHDDMPMFQTVSGDRFTDYGFRSLMLRLSQKSGIKFSPHVLRRTFAKLAVKSGMNIIYIQQLMGHANIDTTRSYIQNLDDEDILENHAKFGVVDNQIKKIR